MGDVEDPYLYAAGPLHEWEQTEEAVWLKSKCNDLVFFCDTHDYGFMIRIYAPLEGEALTFYNLKYLGIRE
jgi:hypothetical protein